MAATELAEASSSACQLLLPIRAIPVQLVGQLAGGEDDAVSKLSAAQRLGILWIVNGSTNKK